jgi:hypothetical protein
LVWKEQNNNDQIAQQIVYCLVSYGILIGIILAWPSPPHFASKKKSPADVELLISVKNTIKRLS